MWQTWILIVVLASLGTISKSSAAVYGGDAVAREILDTATDFIMIPNPTDAIESDGAVMAWSVYNQAERPDGELYGVVLRPVSGLTYSVVGSTKLPASPVGRQDISLGADQVINVQAGDFVGLAYQGGSTVPFDTTTCEHHWLLHRFKQPTNGEELSFSDQGHWPCREYSIQATIGTTAVYGGDAVAREILDTAADFIMIPDPTDAIESDGAVMAWSVYNQADRPTGELYGVVLRPVSGLTYSVVGSTKLPTSPVGRQDISLSSDQVIPVKAGDFVGLAYQGGSTVPFDTTTCQHHWLLHRFKQPTNGEELSFSDQGHWPCRLYAIQATVVG